LNTQQSTAGHPQMKSTASRVLVAVVSTLLLARQAGAAQSPEERNLSELRNTVVNLLQALVDRGVMTREQAQALVKNAQDKAASDTAAAEAQAKEEAGAIRVPYVPEIVKDQIKEEVAEQVTPEVTKRVISEAKSEQWGVPGALPDWIQRIAWSGDVRVRGEGDQYPAGNAQGVYLNYNAVNAAGGIAKAGNAAFLNTSVDRHYMLVRLRLDMNAQLNSGWSVGARVSTGTLTNPDSLNQVLGQYGGRYTTDIDLAYLRWSGSASQGRQLLTLWGGKFPNPYLYSDLVWMPDVTFEGAAADYRIGLGRSSQTPHYWFVTLGAIPQQNVPLTDDYGPASNNKWLYAAQTGLDFKFAQGSRLRFGVAYYDYSHIAGQLNALDSNLLDYTAPPYMQKGNTVFDIRNSLDPTQNLFALAADFRELDVMLATDWMLTPAYRLSFFADYVKNLAFNEAAVSSRVGVDVRPRVKGYESQVTFGSPRLDHAGAWDAFLGYRYVQRDAVVDAFTDQDYHLGGTDNRGYIIGTDVSFTDRVTARLRYMPFEAIDGPPLAIDVWQLEVIGRF
jgi:polyhydroxyalkanoate synthesis regulator phasin